MIPRLPTRGPLLVIGTLAFLLAQAGPASAVDRTCDPNDPVANTANVICIDIGACDGSTVSLIENVDVKDGVGCEFDMGGRDFIVTKTMNVTGLGLLLDGFIKVINADDITITTPGKLKARGDFEVGLPGFVLGGGTIELNAAGAFTSDGLLDVAGDSAGTIDINAGTDILFDSGSVIRGNGISIAEEGLRFADGATLDVSTTGGSITIDGDVDLRGQDQGGGGFATFTASHDINVNKKIDAVGGGGDGGDVELIAGDDVTLTKPIDVSSDAGGGSGGLMALTAGDDTIGDPNAPGAVVGGDLDVNDVVLKAQGSAAETFAGDGGDIDASAHGTVRFFGSNVAVRVDAATSFDGAGGTLIIDSGDDDLNSLGPLDGDVEFGGLFSAGSGNDDGEGGTLIIDSGRDITLTADIEISGRGGGGDLLADAGRDIVMGASVSADGTSAGSQGGTVELTAGEAVDAGLTITSSFDAVGGSQSGPGPSMILAGCDLTIDPSIKIDAQGGVDTGGNPGGADISLVSLRPMTLGANSEYLAGPGGSISLRYPVGADPVIGAGVVFSPTETTVEGPTTGFLTCPGCGNGILEIGEDCDDGNGLDGDCCTSSCTIEPAATVCRPAANTCDVDEVCDGISGLCPADTLPPTDHYVMYKAGASKNLLLPLGGKLPKGWNSQFNDLELPDTEPDDPENYQLKKTKSLVLAAARNEATDAVNPDLNYIRYQAKGSKEGAGPFDAGTGRYPKAEKHKKGRVWELENEFGTVNITTKKVEAVMIPTAFDLTTPPVAPGDATHYECYKAQVTKDITGQTPDAGGFGKFRKDLEVFLEDPFDDCALDKSGAVPFSGTDVEGKCLYNLKKVKSFCNAVSKDDVGGTPPRETIAPPGSVSTPTTCKSLLCYQAKLSSKVLSDQAAGLANVVVESSLRQSKHAKRSLAAGNAPHTTPGNNLPAPLQTDTKKTEFICVPTSVNDLISPP